MLAIQAVSVQSNTGKIRQSVEVEILRTNPLMDESMPRACWEGAKSLLCRSVFYKRRTVRRGKARWWIREIMVKCDSVKLNCERLWWLNTNPLEEGGACACRRHQTSALASPYQSFPNQIRYCPYMSDGAIQSPWILSAQSAVNTNLRFNLSFGVSLLVMDSDCSKCNQNVQAISDSLQHVSPEFPKLSARWLSSEPWPIGAEVNLTSCKAIVLKQEVTDDVGRVGEARIACEWEKSEGLARETRVIGREKDILHANEARKRLGGLSCILGANDWVVRLRLWIA